MTRDHLTNLLLAPSIKGGPAALGVILSAGVPSLIRTAVDGFVSGCELTIYLPFVLLAVIFMGWKHAVATVMLSALLAETVVLGSHHSVLSACSIYSLSVFLSASAVMIALVHALDAFLATRGKQSGETVLMRALEALQGERYLRLAERRPANEAFLYGWLANRIGTIG